MLMARVHLKAVALTVSLPLSSGVCLCKGQMFPSIAKKKSGVGTC